jgi:hypothetical protein
VVSLRLDRENIREKTLEGQRGAANGNHGGRPKVIGDDMLTFAQSLRAKGVPVPDIAAELVIKTGARAGKNPSVAPCTAPWPTPTNKPATKRNVTDDAWW